MTGLPLFAVALAAPGLMGFAIQRGATCLVVAVEELLAQRKATRLLALLEGGLWVAAGLLVVQAAGGLSMRPAPFPWSAWTVLGGALLGLGAWVNRGCLFGTVARLGNGEWAYLATPLGFFLGCLSFGRVLPPPPPHVAGSSPVLSAPGWVAVLCLILVGWRIATHLRRRRWSPHLATLVIAATFLVTLLLVGNWSYADVLAEAARGMSREVAARLLLLAALLSGAVLGGRLAGNRATSPPRMSGVLRCLAGGWIMAWGGMLVPGQNDGLILLGMPLLWPHAWIGVLAMSGAIALARSLAR